MYTGIRDAGVDLDAGAPFWSGLEDRVHNFFRLESSVSLHVLFGLTTGRLAVGRLLWCAWARDAVLRDRQRYLFTAVALLGLWVLFGGAQVGGGISHR